MMQNLSRGQGSSLNPSGADMAARGAVAIYKDELQPEVCPSNDEVACMAVRGHADNSCGSG